MEVSKDGAAGVKGVVAGWEAQQDEDRCGGEQDCCQPEIGCEVRALVRDGVNRGRHIS